MSDQLSYPAINRGTLWWEDAEGHLSLMVDGRHLRLRSREGLELAAVLDAVCDGSHSHEQVVDAVSRHTQLASAVVGQMAVQGMISDAVIPQHAIAFADRIKVRQFLADGVPLAIDTGQATPLYLVVAGGMRPRDLTAACLPVGPAVSGRFDVGPICGPGLFHDAAYHLAVRPGSFSGLEASEPQVLALCILINDLLDRLLVRVFKTELLRGSLEIRPDGTTAPGTVAVDADDHVDCPCQEHGALTRSEKFHAFPPASWRTPSADLMHYRPQYARLAAAGLFDSLRLPLVRPSTLGQTVRAEGWRSAISMPSGPGAVHDPVENVSLLAELLAGLDSRQLDRVRRWTPTGGNLGSVTPLLLWRPASDPTPVSGRATVLLGYDAAAAGWRGITRIDEPPAGGEGEWWFGLVADHHKLARKYGSLARKIAALDLGVAIGQAGLAPFAAGSYSPFVADVSLDRVTRTLGHGVLDDLDMFRWSRATATRVPMSPVSADPEDWAQAAQDRRSIRSFASDDVSGELMKLGRQLRPDALFAVRDGDGYQIRHAWRDDLPMTGRRFNDADTAGWTIQAEFAAAPAYVIPLVPRNGTYEAAMVTAGSVLRTIQALGEIRFGLGGTITAGITIDLLDAVLAAMGNLEGNYAIGAISTLGVPATGRR